VLIIANPTAGAGAGRVNKERLLEVAQRDLERGGLEVEMCLEVDREAVVARAERGAKENYRAIIAAGGDGTINAVVNGLMQALNSETEKLAAEPTSTTEPTYTPTVSTNSQFTLPPLGVLPMGTGNVFAFNMGIDKSWRGACRVIREGGTRYIDVGWAKTPEGEHLQHFLLMGGIGFDAQVVENTSLRLKYVLRDFAYVLKTLENVVLHQGTKVTLTLDNGRVYTENSWQVMVGNVASYAWAIKFTQRARLDDGFVDVCCMPFHNKFVSVQQAMQILTGQHVQRGIARYWKTKQVKIVSEPPVPVQLDGDEWGYTPVVIGVLPSAIKVLSPPTEDADDTLPQATSN
jgi:diacylglycerol kinase family enzyme